MAGGPLVAPPGVVGQVGRPVPRAVPTYQPCGERVADALRGHGVLEQAGVADSAQPGPVAGPDEAAQHRLRDDDAGERPVAPVEQARVERRRKRLQGGEVGLLALRAPNRASDPGDPPRTAGGCRPRTGRTSGSAGPARRCGTSPSRAVLPSRRTASTPRPRRSRPGQPEAAGDAVTSCRRRRRPTARAAARRLPDDAAHRVIRVPEPTSEDTGMPRRSPPRPRRPCRPRRRRGSPGGSSRCGRARRPA